MSESLSQGPLEFKAPTPTHDPMCQWAIDKSHWCECVIDEAQQ